MNNQNKSNENLGELSWALTAVRVLDSGSYDHINIFPGWIDKESNSS